MTAVSEVLSHSAECNLASKPINRTGALQEHGPTELLNSESDREAEVNSLK